MKYILGMLLLLTAIAGQAVRAADPPADSSDMTTQPADTTRDTGTGSEAPGGGEKEDAEEPDCE